MRYLVTGLGEPFYTEWFSPLNHFEYGMVIYDLVENLYYDDDGDWKEIDNDHL